MSKARDIANILSASTAIATDAEVASTLLNYATIASPTFTGTVGGITKSMVGLGNVDNTADTSKPISTATQTALDLKANKGALNYTQVLATRVVGTSGAATLGSATITTSGYPVHIMATGDAENTTAGGWARLQLYRGSTAIGTIVHVEGSAGSENIPFALQFIDTQAAGTYTYSLKTINTAGGNFNFGETDGPTITLVELGK